MAFYHWDDDEEIAYWRKCWNVRYAIADAIDGINDNRNTDITYDNVIAIIKELKKFNKRNWLHNGWDGSIWEWKEIKKSHRGHIKRLKKLSKLMKKYPIIEVYFYDSY